MKLHNPSAEIFIPDNTPTDEAFDRVTHMGIGGHQDDLEIMACHGILQCLHTTEQWFGGIVCTSGGGSARQGPYADYSDEDMRAARHQEQNTAATIGQFGFVAQLDYESSDIKNPANTNPKDDIERILRATHPSVLYTHNPADKHDTHIGTLISTLAAVRELPRAERPQTVYGCEVWRTLDWLVDSDKVALDISGHENLTAAMLGVYDSQIAGGKRYDLATLGRGRANATYYESHAVDATDLLCFAMDLTPLAHNDDLDIVDYVGTFLEHFAEDVKNKLKRMRSKV